MPKELDFHYLKTPCYRTYHVDGIFGGIAPNGNLYMELFIERFPTPKVVRCKLTPEGPGEEVSREGKDGVIREVEGGLVMNINTATTLRDWLDGKINEYKATRMKAEGKS